MIVSGKYFKFILYVTKRTPFLRITIVVIAGKFSKISELLNLILEGTMVAFKWNYHKY